VLRPGHPIFAGPFAVEPKLEATPTPANFKQYDPKFGDTLETFAIFSAKSAEPGLVTSNIGFEETPDAEMILGGINMKGPKFAAVARHGSVVQWGFHGKFNDFTDAGRRLFLNTLAYAAAHRGDRVEVLRQFETRDGVAALFDIYMAMYLAEPQGKEMLKAAVQRYFPGVEPPAEALEKSEAGRAWLRGFVDYLRPMTGRDVPSAYALAIDEDCRTLGIGSRRPEFLGALAKRLEANANDPLAALLIDRYVPGVAPAAFAAWLKENKEKLYYTESGGYVWRVRGVPAPSAMSVVAESPNEPVSASAEITERCLLITLEIDAPYHLYAPGSKDGDPVTIRFSDESAWSIAGEPVFDGKGQLVGTVKIRVPLKRKAWNHQRFECSIGYTACDPQSCRPRATLVVRQNS
jgi:hypothetical protein